MIAGFHLDSGIGIEENIHARAELDQAHALAAGHGVTDFHVEDNSARDQPRDLLEHYRAPLACHGHDVLFVFIGEAAAMAFRNLPRW